MGIILSSIEDVSKDHFYWGQDRLKGINRGNIRGVIKKKMIMFEKIRMEGIKKLNLSNSELRLFQIL